MLKMATTAVNIRLVHILLGRIDEGLNMAPVFRILRIER
jgi:hypothetical protein